jgi:P-type Mg2+ transporter
VAGLECDESVLTGESVPAEKSAEPVAAGTPLAELSSCALMGTVVRAGSGTGVVVATGGDAEFGRIAVGLGEHQPETEFQVGLRKFSMLLVQVAGVLTGAIFVINVALHKPVIDALLFSLSIAVGISPQLLPAVVSTSLAAGSRQLARSKVLVKRLVCIEDLGDIDVLFTDKTGTLTEGSLHFMRSAGPDGMAADEPLLRGLLCNEAVVEDGRPAVGNPLDVALWDSPAAAGQRAALARYRRLDTLPFDHERRLVSVLTEDDRGHRMIITKGAPESLLERCTDVPAAARAALDAEFAAGNRVVAVATREAPGRSSITPADEHGLRFRGLLVFLDPPKPDARGALRRLAGLGITVKILTGDNPAVARRSAPTSACRPDRWPPAPTSTPRATGSATCSPGPRCSPGSAPSTRPRSSGRSGAPATTWPSSATASTTRSRCTPPTSASRSTRPPTWPRTPPTCCCWKRTWTCWPTASWAAAGSLPTPSSTC